MKKNLRMILLFVIGVIAGTTLANLFGKTYLNQIGIFNENFVESMLQLPIKSGQYFWYLVRIRGIAFLLLWLIILTRYRLLWMGMCSVWYGGCLGLLVSAATLSCGIKGILLFLAVVFPQYIFYFVLYLIFMQKAQEENLHRPNKWERRRMVFQCLASIGVLTLGMVTEAFVNPLILKRAMLFIWR